MWLFWPNTISHANPCELTIQGGNRNPHLEEEIVDNPRTQKTEVNYKASSSLEPTGYEEAGKTKNHQKGCSGNNWSTRPKTREDGGVSSMIPRHMMPTELQVLSAIAQRTSCICKWWSVRVLMWQMEVRTPAFDSIYTATLQMAVIYSEWSDPSLIIYTKVLRHSQSMHLVDWTFGSGQCLISSAILFNLENVASTCVLYCSRVHEAKRSAKLSHCSSLRYACCPLEFQVEAPPLHLLILASPVLGKECDHKKTLYALGCFACLNF